MENSLIIILIQIVLIFVLITIITFFLRLNETIKIEKRISKYSIKGSRNKYDKSYPMTSSHDSRSKGELVVSDIQL